MRRKLLIAAGVALALVVALLGAAWWQARSVLGELQAGPKRAVVDSVKPELGKRPHHVLVPTTTAPAAYGTGTTAAGAKASDGFQPPVLVDPQAETILLIGSDHRWGAGKQARSDTILLARVDPNRHRVALLSIPRDLYVAIPGHGHDRINMAFDYGGEKLLTRTVRETFGVSIDHFVEIDFHGFKQMIDRLGGLYVPVDQRYYNRNVGTPGTNYSDIDLQPGYQRLDGAEALAFARYRHTDSDLVRAARQQLVLREAVRQALKHKYDVLEVRSLVQAFAKATTSDISSLREVWTLVETLRSTPSSALVRMTVPAGDFTLYGASYVRASDAQLAQTVRRWLGADEPSGGSGRPPARAPARAGGATADLVADGGRGEALVRGVSNGIRTCAPSKLPPSYWWPQGSAARGYVLDGHPAIALSATRGSGRSLLWTFTTWDRPPALEAPTRTVRRGGVAYDLWFEGGRLRQVAWRIGPTRAWITNTLRDELSARQMLALARSCRSRAP